MSCFPRIRTFAPIPVLVAVALLLVVPSPASAGGFLIPFIGYNFGGDSGNCPTLTTCDERHMNFGASLGSMGSIFGFEEDISFAKNFFGDADGVDNSVFSAMSNLLIGVGVGPIRPYVVGGLGLVRSHVETSLQSVVGLTGGKTSLGYDLGGGVTVLFAPHVGIRGDLRHFHTLQDVNLLTFGGEKLDFWRASAGLALTF
jgi:opacity protein-like surface antigen